MKQAPSEKIAAYYEQVGSFLSTQVVEDRDVVVLENETIEAKERRRRQESLLAQLTPNTQERRQMEEDSSPSSVSGLTPSKN